MKVLYEAVAEIRAAADAATSERESRVAAGRALRRAEEFGCILEEHLLEGRRELPDELIGAIRGFVAEHERALLRRIGEPVSTLDALFDLQECLQIRRADDPASGLVSQRVA